MAQKNSIILGFTLLVLLGSWLVITQQQRATTPGKPNQFIAEMLKDKLESIQTLKIVFNGETFSLEKKDNKWVVPSRKDYPADQALITKTLLNAAQLDVIEKKTALATQHPKLHLEDATVKGGNSTELVLIDKENKAVLNVLLGKKSQDGKGFHARLVGEDQTWLVMGDLALEPKPEAWIEKLLIDIKRPRLKSVHLSQGVTLTRSSPDQEDFTLKNPPANRKVKTGYWLNSVVNAIEKLEIEDVTKTADLKTPSVTSSTATFITFDGLVLNATILKSGKESWVSFKAAYEEKEVVKPVVKEGEKAPEPTDIPAEVKALNAKFEGWSFKLSEFKLGKFETKIADLLEPLEPKTKAKTNPTDSEEN